MNMDLFFVVLLTFLVGFLTMKLAERRGRNGPIWFCLGVLGGIFAVIALLLLKPIKSEEDDGGEEALSFFPFGTSRQEESEKKQTKSAPFPSWDPALYDWYYLDKEKKQEGPLAFNELLGLWKEGKISLDTYIWYEELSDWKRLDALPSLLKNLEEFENKEVSEDDGV